MSDDTKQISVKLPIALHGLLVQAAEGDRRSLHAEILTLLEEALEARATTARSTRYVVRTSEEKK